MCNDVAMIWLWLSCIIIPLSGVRLPYLGRLKHSIAYSDRIADGPYDRAVLIGVIALFWAVGGPPCSIATMALGILIGLSLLLEPSVRLGAKLLMVMAATTVTAVIDRLQGTSACQASLRFQATQAREQLLDNLQGISHVGIFPVFFATYLQ